MIGACKWVHVWEAYKAQVQLVNARSKMSNLGVPVVPSRSVSHKERNPPDPFLFNPAHKKGKAKTVYCIAYYTSIIFNRRKILLWSGHSDVFAVNQKLGQQALTFAKVIAQLLLRAFTSWHLRIRRILYMPPKHAPIGAWRQLHAPNHHNYWLRPAVHATNIILQRHMTL